MPTTVIMPTLELAQETGKVVHWLKRAGDTVRKGEPIVEIETDKVTVEIEAPASGVLRDVTAQEGDVVPVGRTIAIVVGTDEAGAAAAAATVMPPASAAATGAIPIPPTAVSAASTSRGSERRADGSRRPTSWPTSRARKPRGTDGKDDSSRLRRRRAASRPSEGSISPRFAAQAPAAPSWRWTCRSRALPRRPPRCRARRASALLASVRSGESWPSA